VLCEKTYYCNNNVTVPANVALLGSYGPRPGPSFSVNNNMPSQLIFGGNYGIIQTSSSSVRGLVIISLTAFQNGASYSLGNGIYSANPADNSCSDCGIFGFANAVVYGATGNGGGRNSVQNVFFDCQAGISIIDQYDICDVARCHSNNYLGSTALRTGAAYTIQGGNSSWHKVMSCFAYGYATGFANIESGNNQFLNCGIDGNFVGGAGAGVGFSSTGNSYGTVVYDNCQTTSTVGFDIDMTNSGSPSSNPNVIINSPQVWGPTGTGIFNVASGSVSVTEFVNNSGRTDIQNVSAGASLYIGGTGGASYGAQTINISNDNSGLIISGKNTSGTGSVNQSAEIVLLNLNSTVSGGNKYFIRADGEEGFQILTYDSGALGALYLAQDGSLRVTGTLSTPGGATVGGALYFTSSVSLAGTTAGSIQWGQYLQGVFKEFSGQALGYENNTTTAQTITFPTAFSYTPVVTLNTTGLTLTVSATALTIVAPDTTTAYSGVIEVKGF